MNFFRQCKYIVNSRLVTYHSFKANLIHNVALYVETYLKYIPVDS